MRNVFVHITLPITLNSMTTDELSNLIIGMALKIHRVLGPGLLESAYQACMRYELRKAGLRHEYEKAVPIVYDGLRLDHGYRLDILVEGQVVIELKTVEALTDVHLAQMLTYLKLGRYPLGLIINFHTKRVKDGVRRVINSKAVTQRTQR